VAETFFAVCPRGLEAILARELAALGASAVKAGNGGAVFAGTLATAYAANLHSRIASRVLWRVATGGYRSETDLYEMAHGIAWEQHFAPHQRLRVDVTASRSPLRSLQFATLRVKDAIVDRARERSGTRPSIDRAMPDVQVLAHLDEHTAQLYIDLSGESLFKRGWRADKGEAPIKENLAAALLIISGWSPHQVLLDPFCGSGTIVIEAACMATGRAPGLQRQFGFEKLLGFDRPAWTALQQQARGAVCDDVPLLLVGRDISTQVIAIARANALRAGLAPLLQAGTLVFEAGDARSGEPPIAVFGGAGAPPLSPGGMVVTNPPYGEQSNPKSASVASMMADVATQLKRRFAGWQAWLLSSDRKLPQQMRLSESGKTVLFNGALECRLFRFEMVAGSNRRGPSQEAPTAEPESGPGPAPGTAPLT
jgi:putative N6-adenine-specific DNA methylase